MTTPEPKAKQKKSSTVTYYEGVGRRSEAVARVRAYIVKKGVAKVGETELKAGSFIVNDKSIEKVFTTRVDQIMCRKPLAITDSLDRFVVTVRIIGGGTSGRVGAVIHGLARALAQDPTGADKLKLRAAGFLTRDARTRERRMVGTGGKARRLKQSPKR